MRPDPGIASNRRKLGGICQRTMIPMGPRTTGCTGTNDPDPVPEPSPLVLLGFGMLALLVRVPSA